MPERVRINRNRKTEAEVLSEETFAYALDAVRRSAYDEGYKAGFDAGCVTEAANLEKQKRQAFMNGMREGRQEGYREARVDNELTTTPVEAEVDDGEWDDEEDEAVPEPEEDEDDRPRRRRYREISSRERRRRRAGRGSRR